MDKDIARLEGCLKAMKKCFKIPKVENCVCFSDAFKVLNSEVNELEKRLGQLDDDSKAKLKSLRQEIEEISSIISKGDKGCLGCSVCMASVVFKAYPDKLDNLYMDDKL
jgi:hypothetical protein